MENGTLETGNTFIGLETTVHSIGGSSHREVPCTDDDGSRVHAQKHAHTHAHTHARLLRSGNETRVFFAKFSHQPQHHHYRPN